MQLSKETSFLTSFQFFFIHVTTPQYSIVTLTIATSVFHVNNNKKQAKK